MATSRRASSAPLYVSPTDEIAGYPSRETGSDPLILAPGSHQFLGHQASKHDGQSTLAPGGNKVQRGQTPRTSSPPVGAPDAVNPLGHGWASSLTG